VVFQKLKRPDREFSAVLLSESGSVTGDVLVVFIVVGDYDTNCGNVQTCPVAWYPSG